MQKRAFPKAPRLADTVDGILNAAQDKGRESGFPVYFETMWDGIHTFDHKGDIVKVCGPLHVGMDSTESTVRRALKTGNCTVRLGKPGGSGPAWELHRATGSPL